VTWSAPAFGELAALLSRSIGLEFPASRITFAELGMRRAMSRAREGDASAFVRRVAREPILFQSVVAEVVVGETYFFRDAGQFEVIRTTVLPEILARRTAEPMRVWSAGCASGEEAYSLAILFEHCNVAERAQLVATDISAASIAAAYRGRYPARSFRGDVDPWRAHCFGPAGDAWLIDPRFRGRISFAVHNLTAEGSDGIVGERQFDLILCRNVLIYLEPQALDRALRLLAGRLAPGGWLLMSPTDPIVPPDALLERVDTNAGSVYRRIATHTVTTSTPASPEIVPLASPRLAVARRREPQARAAIAVTPLPEARPDDSAAAAPHIAEALRLLDDGRPGDALVAARRARYLDRTAPVAHLALGRAFRLCGRIDAARRALRRCRVLLAAHGVDDPIPGTDGASAGALAAIVAAELTLLARRRVGRTP
jgi:chemotaxis protein methyltransferase CheR